MNKGILTKILRFLLPMFTLILLYINYVLSNIRKFILLACDSKQIGELTFYDYCLIMPPKN